MGDALKLAINSARVPVPDGLGGDRAGCPRAIVLLGDGASTRGADPIDVVQDTKKYKIPVYTVALGTPERHARRTPTRTRARRTTERVPPDLLTLQDIARDTGGQFFATADAQAAADRLPQPRHAADQDQGEAAGDVGVRRRRAGAAAGRRGLRRCARRDGCREARRRPDRRAHAGQARPGSRPARGPALARPRGDEADREPRPRRAPDAADRLRHRAGDDPAVLPGRRRPPHRLERDRAPAGAARARARGRAGADDAGWCSTSSASMAFGTADRRKADVAEGVALAVGHVATRRGNRLGVLAFGGGEPRIMRPRQGRLGLLALLAELRREPRPTAPARRRSARRWRGAAAVGRQRGPGRDRVRLPRRARLGGAAAARCARATACSRSRSSTRASRSSSPAGDLWLVDPETGRQVHVDTRTRRVRQRFAAGRRGRARRGPRRAAPRGRRPRRALHRGRLAADPRRPPAPRRGRAARRRTGPRGGREPDPGGSPHDASPNRSCSPASS